MAAVKVPVKELRVLVHPHYSALKGHARGNVLAAGRNTSDFASLNLRQRTRELVAKDPHYSSGHYSLALGENRLKQLEAVDRFYRREIQRVKETPGTRLVIIQSTMRMAPTSPPESIEEYVGSFQARLIKLARKKLGRKLHVLTCNSHSVGNAFRDKFDPNSGIPVIVFGEYNGFCVSQAAGSLIQAGFRTKVADSK